MKTRENASRLSDVVQAVAEETSTLTSETSCGDSPDFLLEMNI